MLDAKLLNLEGRASAIQLWKACLVVTRHSAASPLRASFLRPFFLPQLPPVSREPLAPFLRNNPVESPPRSHCFQCLHLAAMDNLFPPSGGKNPHAMRPVWDAYPEMLLWSHSSQQKLLFGCLSPYPPLLPITSRDKIWQTAELVYLPPSLSTPLLNHVIFQICLWSLITLEASNMENF